MMIRDSKMTFYESCFSFEKSQCKIKCPSNHGDISPYSNSRIRLPECESRVD